MSSPLLVNVLQLLADGLCAKHDLELADFTPHMEEEGEGEGKGEEEGEGEGEEEGEGEGRQTISEDGMGNFIITCIYMIVY